MRDIIHHLVEDERGFIISSELVIIATILVLGLVVGMTILQTALIEEFTDVGRAVSSLNQSYRVSGFQSTGSGACRIKAWKGGSGFTDAGALNFVTAAHETGGAVRQRPLADLGMRPTCPVPTPPTLPSEPCCPAPDVVCPQAVMPAIECPQGNPCLPYQPGVAEPIPFQTPTPEQATPVPQRSLPMPEQPVESKA